VGGRAVSHVFRLALGLAAIDGLTSAFVATLILAFSVIGSGERSSAPDMSATTIIEFKKSSYDDASMKIGLLAAIYTSSNAALSISSYNRQAGGLLPISTASPLTKGGSVRWFDCTSEFASCSSQLMITKPAKTCWVLKLSPATTMMAFSDFYPSKIKLESRIFPRASGQPLDPIELLLDGSWQSFQIDFTSEVPRITRGEKCATWS
jgi:hypothetical protein